MQEEIQKKKSPKKEIHLNHMKKQGYKKGILQRQQKNSLVS